MIYLNGDDCEKAKEVFEKALVIQISLHGENNEEVGDLFFEIATVYLKLSDNK